MSGNLYYTAKSWSQKKDDKSITWRVHTASQPGGGRFPRTISGGSCLLPASTAPLPSKAPTSLLPLNSRGAVWGGFGPLATYHFFFGVTIILGNISLHCNYMCIFKYAKVLTLSLTQLGSQGNLEKILFGEVLGWRIWSGGGPSCARKYTVGRKNFHWCLIHIWHFYSKVFPLKLLNVFLGFAPQSAFLHNLWSDLDVIQNLVLSII